MHWSDLDLRPNDAKLRQFAAIGCGMLLLLAAYSRAIGFAAAAIVVAIGIWKPFLIRPLYVALTVVSFPIGWVVSRVVLFAVYMLVLTPVGIVMRLLGRDPLARKRRNAESYWKPKDRRRDVASYFAQF